MDKTIKLRERERESQDNELFQFENQTEDFDRYLFADDIAVGARGYRDHQCKFDHRDQQMGGSHPGRAGGRVMIESGV